VVLDTNVLVSAYSWEGNEEWVVSRCGSGEFRSITSPEILDELGDVLFNKFNVPIGHVIEYLEKVILMSEIVFPEGDVDVITDDPSDNSILETAMQGKAGLIVTGDRHLLALGTFEGVRILRAAELIRLTASR